MNKKQQVMELWRRCFHDTDEFVRFYFSHKYSDENSLVYEADGKALAALQMLPYPMSWAGTTWATSYISGACTLPEARNRGIMTILLQTAFSDMYKRDIALTTLIPAEDWLFDYYAHLGYATVFDYSTVSVSAGAFGDLSVKVQSPEGFDEEWVRRFFPYFDRHMKARPCCVQHPYEDFVAIVQDIYLAGGRVVITRTEATGTLSGIALAVPGQEQVVVKEMFYESQAEKEALVATLENIFSSSVVVCRTPPNYSDYQHLGMARIICARRLLEYYAGIHPELSLTLKLNDPQVSMNQGVYTLAQGHCNFQQEADVPIDWEADISLLTRALLGYQTEQLPPAAALLLGPGQPYMNLMLE